ncbi:VCBS repeat-containing protein [Flagellimonas sediminis]|uniref:CRTAC1 family protein n=1 Tax=Flagellimonas sediminis TaxID=2696468 RepID=A0A6I5KT74_9FLAO|nr:VCBS repeat-containing protein [Allomuricauda sediminis]NDV43787.1 CRTAC1 family protein [Allomuricauda sediminis]
MGLKFKALSVCLIMGVALTIGIGSCTRTMAEDAMFTQLDPASTGIKFVNDVHIGTDFNILTYRNFYNGGGVGIGDINNDGLPDIYLIKNQGGNRLYLNKGDFVFQDITETAGVSGTKMWSTGVTMVDVNADGLLDIYVCNAGITNKKNELFINNGDLTFTEMASKYNLDEEGFTTHAAFFDYDGDGDLDVYILNNSFILPTSLGFSNLRELRSEDWRVPEVFKAGGDKLLRNDNGHFTDVSEQSGIYGSLIGFGLGVTIGDVNNDDLPDIYISNDFFERDYLYINQGDGTFREESKNYIQHSSLSSMGADMADLNNDHFPDIFVTDMRPGDDERLKNNGGFETFDLHKKMQERDFYNQFMQNTMQINNGDGSFSETAYYSGVAETDWSWGALILDMDNDGYKDILVCNGIYKDITNNDFINYFANESASRTGIYTNEQTIKFMEKIPSVPISNFAFQNNHDLTFTDRAKEWGLGKPGFSNGAAYGDLDNDGDLDLVINNVNQEISVFRNNTSSKTENNFIKVKLQGEGKNKFAVGSKVTIYSGNQSFYQELIPSRGFQSSVDYELLFGLGATQAIDSIRVLWPDKSSSLLSGITANQTLTIEQSDSNKKRMVIPKVAEQYMMELAHGISGHIEDRYNDYNIEGTISRMLSKEGPAIAVGDINNDGLDDLYLGGAKEQAGTIYLQENTGSFLKIDNGIFEKDKGYEDTSAVFADTNGDNMPDLIVSSGGNNIFQPTESYATRIYINTGKGKFVENTKGSLPTTTNTSIIAPNDFDGDGDIDLFIGSRSVVGVYGKNPEHYLFENNGKGGYSNVTQTLMPGIMEIGMITDAQWADMDNDGQKELLLVGDWMAPMIFKKFSDGFAAQNTGLEGYKGAWNTIKIADLNNDGRNDMILGNRGSNSFFNVFENEPVRMYVNDFDDNGTVEQIFARQVQGKMKPIHLRIELLRQIPQLGKNSPTFSDYATKSMMELFPIDVLQKSTIKEINTFKSVVVHNLGNNEFEVQELPMQAQLSSIHAVEAIDLNSDGFMDLIMAGNDIDLKPQFGRLDSNYGLVLVGEKDGSFTAVNSEVSGFFLKGEVKHLNLLKNKDGHKLLLVGINNSRPKLFKLREKQESNQR